jgi:hypothetical protein
VKATSNKHAAGQRKNSLRMEKGMGQHQPAGAAQKLDEGNNDESLRRVRVSTRVNVPGDGFRSRAYRDE